MSTEPYTVEEKVVSDVCVASMTMDRVTFDRFIAKIKADALREAARKLFSDKTAESGTTKAKHNAIYGLWLLDEADRIEEEP